MATKSKKGTTRKPTSASRAPKGTAPRRRGGELSDKDLDKVAGGAVIPDLYRKR